MPSAPDVIFVARHGARLDAADKSWHLSSPAPYDPPLTYGGWGQARALGNRIAGILHMREQEQQSELKSSTAINGADEHKQGSLAGPPRLQLLTASSINKKKKKRRIIIHTSPFLRCVQTSIGISSGLSQYNGGLNKLRLSKTPSRPSTPMPEHRDLERNGYFERMPLKIELAPGPAKPKLRIDAFLGEWLSPEYYDLITPPPSSTMMVAGAKADLLRRGEYVEAAQAATLNMGNFPGGWGSSNSHVKTPSGDRDALARMGSLAEALPSRDRSSTLGNVANGGLLVPKTNERSQSSAGERGGYVPPVPNYAVAGVDPIPCGYVSHARDACTDIDWQWDSMREPLNWPDGGVYGEEWSTMHKRFRQGLNDMVNWYKEHGTQPQSQDIVLVSEDGQVIEDDDDDDAELVLVLVTHAAGCNALIGALTNQPVLLDIGIASMTMAIRKGNDIAQVRNDSKASHDSQQASAIDTEDIVDSYEMRLVASSDHLRPGVDPSRLDHVPSPKIVPRALGEPRRGHRFSAGALGAVPVDLDIGQPRQSAMSAALGSVRRSQSNRSHSNSPHRRTFTPPVNTAYSSRAASPSSMVVSTGLWSSPVSAKPPVDIANNRSISVGAIASALTDLDVGDPKPATTESSTAQPSKLKNEDHNESDVVHPLRPAPASRSGSNSGIQRGMWGANGSGSVGSAGGANGSNDEIAEGLWGAADKTPRERGPKRRWTVNERDNQ